MDYYGFDNEVSVPNTMKPLTISSISSSSDEIFPTTFYNNITTISDLSHGMPDPYSVSPSPIVHPTLNVTNIDEKTLQQLYQLLVYYNLAHNLSQQDSSSPLWQKLLVNLTTELQATRRPWHETFEESRVNNHDDNLYEVPTGIVVLLSIFYGVISLVAVVGNALVMWVVATSRLLHSVTNYFIANLALADIIIGLFAIPFQVSPF